ncbi:MAG: hypothetical protein GY711_09100 [bacterium]|nr:hypothetical protein [bacterium]
MRFLSLLAPLAVVLVGGSSPALCQGSDACATAPTLFGTTTAAFDTNSATDSPPAWPCAVAGNDVWFRWYAPRSDSFVFSTCAMADFDTTLEVFEGSCGALTSLECKDDACGERSEVTISATAGASYYVRVGGSQGARGQGLLSVAPAGAPRIDREALTTSAGTGHAGADVSERHNCVVAYQSNTFRQDDRVIDDFTVPVEPNATGWLVERVRVYAIACVDVSGPPPATPTSTLTQMTLVIWSGPPHQPGSTRLFGDTTTDVLSATGWTNTYRVTSPTTHDETRWPIFFADAEIRVFLPEGGRYFLEWGLDDSNPEWFLDDVGCENLPATPANPNVAGDGLQILFGTPPRPLDPRTMGCTGNAGAVRDDLPFQVFAVPAISVPDPACTALANSTGRAAALVLSGSGLAGDPLEATVGQGPPAGFGYFVSGTSPGLYIVPPGASGIICIGGPQLRYNSVPLGHVFQFDAGGVSQRVIGSGPSPLATDGSFAPVPAVMAGETRWFQAWFRDGATSNFSGSEAVTFQ